MFLERSGSRCPPPVQLPRDPGEGSRKQRSAALTAFFVSCCLMVVGCGGGEKTDTQNAGTQKTDTQRVAPAGPTNPADIEAKIRSRLPDSNPTCSEGDKPKVVFCDITYNGQTAGVVVTEGKAVVTSGGQIVDFFTLD
jgi:hypothetical protein